MSAIFQNRCSEDFTTALPLVYICRDPRATQWNHCTFDASGEEAGWL